MTSENRKMAIIGLTVVTALIHLVLGFQFGEMLFILNGIGYLGLLGLIYLSIDALKDYRQMARYALIVFTLVTIIAYFVVNPDAFTSPLGLIDKAVEAALVVFLVQDRDA